MHRARIRECAAVQFDAARPDAVAETGIKASCKLQQEEKARIFSYTLGSWNLLGLDYSDVRAEMALPPPSRSRIFETCEMNTIEEPRTLLIRRAECSRSCSARPCPSSSLECDVSSDPCAGCDKVPPCMVVTLHHSNRGSLILCNSCPAAVLSLM